MKATIVERVIAGAHEAAVMHAAVGAFESSEDAKRFIGEQDAKYGALLQARLVMPGPNGPQMLPFTVAQLLEQLGVRGIGHRLFEVEPQGTIIMPKPTLYIAGN